MTDVPFLEEQHSAPFATVSDLIARHARERGERRALVDGDRALSYAELDSLLDRFAAGLQRDAAPRGAAIAIVSATDIACAIAYLGTLRAGCVPAPIAPSSTAGQIAAMVEDCGAAMLFVDAPASEPLTATDVATVRLEELEAWLPATGASPARVEIGPQDPFNIIYSSGTTGTPKGIVHSHGMRWTQISAYAGAGFDQGVTMVATPLYSNTTLVSFLPTLAHGGTAVLLGKFDARRFLEIAERERATHAMLVPVQYQRIMAVPDFDSFDLSSFVLKTCTSAPFSAALKADVVRRWPGELLEIYGMTEGGGACLLHATKFPDKLHTVGRPAPGHDIRVIDETGRELAQGEIGEVVGRSTVMMAGYHGRPEATSAAQWTDAAGNVFIRHGDLGRFDEDGFLILLGRSKDMIISGGFNVYPRDLEDELLRHPAVADAAVVGAPSTQWGETPVGFYVPRQELPPETIRAEVNARLGKMQRLSALHPVDELPRSHIGKVLKRELVERLLGGL